LYASVEGATSVSVTQEGHQTVLLREALDVGSVPPAYASASLLLAGNRSLQWLYDEVITPYFVELGERWARGEISISDEHQASAAADELVTLLGTQPTPFSADRGLIVLAAVPGEQHALGMRMLAQVLARHGWRTVVLTALPYDELANYCSGLTGAPVAIGLTMHDVSSLAAIRGAISSLRQRLPGVPVVLGGHAVRSDATLPAKVGAAGGADDVSTGVRLFEEVTNPLTRRERQILQLVAGGCSNAEIANQLSVHASTVKTHLEHVASKLGTSDRTAAAVLALRHGWID
jgi:DNA-binding CsgD family transcriptional regulator